MPPFLENLDELETDYKDKLEKDDNSDGKTFDPFKNLFLAIISSDILVEYPWTLDKSYTEASVCSHLAFAPGLSPSPEILDQGSNTGHA